MIDPNTALAAAREFDAQPTALAAIARNQNGYVVGFEDQSDPFANVEVWVDGTTGQAQALGASDYAMLMPTLELLGRGIPGAPAT